VAAAHAGLRHYQAQNWPEVGQKFAILGIQGESWANWSDLDDLRFNYTYVNWVGRSTYGGYPGTDRESPYLVAELIDELKKTYNFGRVFLGGHSQGAYLTYMMHMHFPEKLAGTFPVAGGMIFQAEPNAFDDKKLMESQRETPMVIVHGKQDSVVEFSMSEYAVNQFLAHGFPRVKLISPAMDHPYDFLPIGDAIRQLDMLTTNDKAALLEYANQQIERKNWRDVGNAISRAKAIKAGSEFSPVWKSLEEAARKGAAGLLKKIEANKNNKWVDDYLEYEQDFFHAAAAQPILEAYQSLREKHAKPADETMKAAREAFQSGNRELGYTKYQEIADKHYASIHYATVRDTLKKQK
jgi:predicted esterase